ncbi:hypothetical protein THTE_4006 [Thermogutta terrifontis]|uniref:Uncharacterized protein n=1 Tax=Thermogutta terrifontis TaxID=1331910 RepID=A0A286RL06_9BACT|nr:hypothetical protein THTE_4006 [Thermogutta terrifontis]
MMTRQGNCVPMEVSPRRRTRIVLWDPMKCEANDQCREATAPSFYGRIVLLKNVAMKTPSRAP